MARQRSMPCRSSACEQPSSVLAIHSSASIPKANHHIYTCVHVHTHAHIHTPMYGVEAGAQFVHTRRYSCSYVSPHVHCVSLEAEGGPEVTIHTCTGVCRTHACIRDAWWRGGRMAYRERNLYTRRYYMPVREPSCAMCPTPRWQSCGSYPLCEQSNSTLQVSQ
jgi:hypothetical protein